MEIEGKSTESEIRNLLAIISGDKQSSIKIFKYLRYKQCAHYRGMGEKFGKLIDVVAHQKEL